MASYLEPPLTAKNGHTLKVILTSRVSDPGPGKQDERSNDDQQALLNAWLAEHTKLPVEVTVVAGSGSGELLDRQELLDLVDHVATGEFDLVMAEDLGRICRRIRAHVFCEECVEHGTRVIALNDRVDTAIRGWQDSSIFSAWHHERSNRDTSDRIKRTHRNRFDSGGCAAFNIYGIIKPPGSKSDLDWSKDPEAEPIYTEWFRKLDDGATYAEVADWLNALAVTTGPFCDSDIWTGTIVGRTSHNILLKGCRYRNKRTTVRNAKGKYVAVKADRNALRLRPVPHLAFIPEAEYDRIIAKVDRRNAKFRRSKNGKPDPRRGQSKKRTRFPGQSVYCGVCGHLFVFGGHGQKDALMCSGAREHKCWNSLTFNGPEVCRLLMEATAREIESLPCFEAGFLSLLQEEVGQLTSRRGEELRHLHHSQRRNERELANVCEALRSVGVSEILLQDLKRLETEKADLIACERKLASLPTRDIQIPDVETVKGIAREEFARLAIDSQEFARFMRGLLPSLYVFPVRLYDSNRLGLRAALQLSASPLIAAEAQQLHGLRERLSKALSLNLFAAPQHEAFRLQVVKLRQLGMTESAVAKSLKLTTTATQRAAALQRKLDEAGLSSPWLPLKAPPADLPKFRRHLHPRYRFEPLEGFPRELPE